MKKAILIFSITAFAVCAGTVLFAQESDVVYTEGWVDLKGGSGEIYELFTGDRVYYGDTVITGADGVAELEPERGSRIIIKPDTVFSIKETDVKGKKQSVVSATLGQVSFKFNRMTNEPLIATPSTVMGIRGTEFTVYAGADGSSLITVESGAVEVSGQGESVYLESDEGVEVKPGTAPGEKFPVMEGSIDFNNWNAAIIDEMLADPSEAVGKLETQLDELAVKAEEWAAAYKESRAVLDELRKQQKTLLAEGKTEEGIAMKENEIRPLEFSTSRLVLNYRYYALSALSLRQHVFSGFYVRMKTAYINDRKNPEFTGFLDEYNRLLQQYEQRVQPLLVEADY